MICSKGNTKVDTKSEVIRTDPFKRNSKILMQNFTIWPLLENLKYNRPSAGKKRSETSGVGEKSQKGE